MLKQTMLALTSAVALGTGLVSNAEAASYTRTWNFQQSYAGQNFEFTFENPFDFKIDPDSLTAEIEIFGRDIDLVSRNRYYYSRKWWSGSRSYYSYGYRDYGQNDESFDVSIEDISLGDFACDENLTCRTQVELVNYSSWRHWWSGHSSYYHHYDNTADFSLALMEDIPELADDLQDQGYLSFLLDLDSGVQDLGNRHYPRFTVRTTLSANPLDVPEPASLLGLLAVGAIATSTLKKKAAT